VSRGRVNQSSMVGPRNDDFRISSLERGDVSPAAKPTPKSRIWTTATVLFFGLTSLVFFQFAPLTGDMAGAVDVTTRQTSPYVEDLEFFERGQNPLQTDQTDAIPTFASFWANVRLGDIRMWEPNLGTGIPIGATYSKVWSPFFWPGVLLNGPVIATFAVWLTLWSAQLGAWALAKRLGIGGIGSVLAGVAYGFSGPVTAFLLRIEEAAIFPWILVGIHCLVARDSSRPTRYVAGIGVAMAAIWLCGFPAAGLFVLYGASAVAVGSAILIHRTQPRTIVRVVVLSVLGMSIGTMLAAPLLLPSYEFLSASESLDRTFSSAHAAGLPLFASSASGRIFGSYSLGTWWWPVRGYSNPYEASITMGLVVLLLLSLGAVGSRCRPSPEATRILGRVYLPVGLVVFAGVFLGGPVLAALQMLPFISSNSFGRSRFILSLVVALAAGNILDGLARPRNGALKPDPLFRVQCGVIVGLAVWSVALVLRTAKDVGSSDLAIKSLVLPSMCLVTAAVLLFFVRRQENRKAGGVMSFGILALLLVELQWGAWGFTPIVPAEEGFYPEHASFDMMRPEASDGLWRFAGTDLVVIRPNQAAWSEISDLRASHPTYEGYRDLMRAMDPEVFDVTRLRTWFTDQLDPSSPGLDRSAVRFLMASGMAGVLEAVESETVVLNGSKVSLVEGDPPVRGLRLDLGDRPCSSGWLIATMDGEEIAHQPLWLVETEPLDLALPDLNGPVDLMLETRGCSTELPATAKVLRAQLDSRLRSLWTQGAVVYERLDARPRVELATAVEGIPDEQKRLERLVSSEDTDVLILNDEHAMAQLGGGTSEIVEDTGDWLTIEVNSNGDGFLVVRDANAPGWQAFVNDQPARILAADHAFRAVEVSDGPSTVTMVYAPSSRIMGLWLAGTAILLLGVIAWMTRRHREETAPDDEPPSSSL
jgi:hypothetical protein